MLTILLSVPVRSELKLNSTFSDKQAVRVFGNLAFGDIPSEIWVWRADSLAVDNGTTVIRPNDVLVANPGRFILFEKVSMPDYTNTATVTSAGNAIFYLTSDKTSTGTALYTNLNFVAPIVNDSVSNYTYGWSYNSTTKALTVNVKASPALNVAAMGLTVLGIPANVANGTSVQVLVKGS